MINEAEMERRRRANMRVTVEFVTDRAQVDELVRRALRDGLMRRHARGYKDEPTPDQLRIVGVTWVMVYNGQHEGEGMAFCMLGDRFDPVFGFRIAFGRALHAIEVENDRVELARRLELTRRMA